MSLRVRRKCTDMFFIYHHCPVSMTPTYWLIHFASDEFDKLLLHSGSVGKKHNFMTLDSSITSTVTGIIVT